jgi:hypothetical protein
VVSVVLVVASDLSGSRIEEHARIEMYCSFVHVRCTPLSLPPGAHKLQPKTLLSTLRSVTSCSHRAHFAFVPYPAHYCSPGWVHTGDRARSGQPKPPGAWTPEQTVLYMLDKLAQGQFYILCPDNDVSTVRSPFSGPLAVVEANRKRWSRC